MLTNRRSLFLLSIISIAAYASWEWVVIERGTYTGQGMDRDRWTAIHECQADMDAQYVALAQRCCQNNNTEFPQYSGRCAGGASNPRSFSGGIRAYFCWPTPTRAEYFPATGYYYVAETRSYSCSELQDTNEPQPTPVSTQVPAPTSTSYNETYDYPYPTATPIPE